MIANEAAMMRPMATADGRRLLIGHVATSIEVGDVVVLVRGDGDQYRLLRVSTDPNDRNDPATLASFLLPDQVDEAELQTAIALAAEATQPQGDPAKRRKGAKR